MDKAAADKQEQEWRAESDARTLIEAGSIKSDPSRLENAAKKLQEQAKAAKRATLEAKVRGRLKNLKPKK